MPLIAQQSGAAPQKKPTFEAQSTVVLLDIVVRDKKGNPVRDLRPDEVKVAEDGVPRNLTAFRLVEGQVSDDRVAGPVPAGLQPDPNRQVSLVTMVFDKILDNRQLSKQAALDFIANNMQSNVWISVFTIDQRLYLRQAFTQDPYLVKQAIFAATSTTSVAAASLAGQASLEEQHAKEAKSIAEQAEAAAAGSATGAGAPNAAAIGGANVEAQMAQVIAVQPPLLRQHPAAAAGPVVALPDARARQGAVEARGQEDADLFLRGARRAEEPRGGLQDHDRRSEPRERDGLCHRRAWPELGARFRGLHGPSC